jgi:hypothetical protein
MKRTKKEIRILEKEIQKADEQDLRFIERSLKESDEGPVSGKIREKIPEKAMTTLEAAFEKGFTMLFTKGDNIIEKTGSIERARREYNKYAMSLDRMIYADTLKAVDKAAGSRVLLSKGVSTAEGSTLGAFGIGMPDIPVFLAMLLKTSYEIAAAYGIDYRDEREKVYTLALFNTAFGRGEQKLRFSEECDDIGFAIDEGRAVDTDIRKEDIEKVSGILATDMLVAKFIQGLTFVGVVGGPLNYRLIHKISKIAKIKYKKRFLHRLLIDSMDR